MKTRTAALATMTAFFISGSALVPSLTIANAAGTGDNGRTYQSNDEKMMYDQDGSMMKNFFTDDSMTTMKSDDDMKKAYEGLGPDSQAQLKSDCRRAGEKRGSYGNVTMSLCDKIGKM